MVGRLAKRRVRRTRRAVSGILAAAEGARKAEQERAQREAAEAAREAEQERVEREAVEAAQKVEQERAEWEAAQADREAGEQARKRREQAITRGRNDAATHFREGDPAGAIAILDKLIEQYPDTAEIQKDREAAATELARQQREAQAQAEKAAEKKAKREAEEQERAQREAAEAARKAEQERTEREAVQAARKAERERAEREAVQAARKAEQERAEPEAAGIARKADEERAQRGALRKRVIMFGLPAGVVIGILVYTQLHKVQVEKPPQPQPADTSGPPPSAVSPEVERKKAKKKAKTMQVEEPSHSARATGTSESPGSPGSSLAAGQVRENAKDGLSYVWIPPGKFMMGCSPGDGECSVDEKPSHEVTITRGFWMGKTEVTGGPASGSGRRRGGQGVPLGILSCRWSL